MKALLAVLGFFAILTTILVYSFGTVVPPGHYGVRQYGMGLYEGFMPEALEPGYHWGEPSGKYTKVHVIPSTLQAIHFHRDYKNRKKKEGGVWRPSLRVETFDKGEVDIDVTVLARLLPRPGVFVEGGVTSGGPSDLATKVGLDRAEWIDRIETDVKHYLRVQLRQLTNAQFYDPALREHEKVKTAQLEMNKELRKIGIDVEAVLLRRYVYEVAEVNTAIAEKNLQVQRERLSDVESDLAKVRAELEELKAGLKAEIDVITRTTPQKVKAIRSEGDLSYSKAEAEGKKLVAQAQAEASKMKAEVFAGMKNADVYLAQELAPLLATLKGGVVSDIDPYNLEDWMKKLGLSERQRRSPSNTAGRN